ncbi:MAG: enoyl-CoA hydratase/isomerase family protein [Rhodospirillales bacterium]|nr:enoyl-CoA hydratase/isomerase family protein [Rhodospirillales bacterium]
MSWQYVSIERKGRIAIVRFDRGNKSNALSGQVMRELTEAALSFQEDSETSAIILTGREDNFTLGMDLKDPDIELARTAPLAQRRKLLQTGPKMCQAWESLEPLTIAAIEGWCVGGGMALNVALDLRVMAEDATLYVPEIERGMNMSWGAVPRLVNLCGPAKTKRIVVLAEKLKAERALDWGIVDEVTPKGQAVTKAMAFAERAAELPPVALRMCKQGVNAAANALNYTASHMDMDQFALAQSSGDFEEGVQAFFEKRKPNYTGS